jgi:hypothetical protein
VVDFDDRQWWISAIGGTVVTFPCGVARWLAHRWRVRASKRRKEEIDMAQNTRQTSPKAASAAGKVLASPKSSKADKTAAASALSQTPKKGK